MNRLLQSILLFFLLSLTHNINAYDKKKNEIVTAYVKLQHEDIFVQFEEVDKEKSRQEKLNLLLKDAESRYENNNLDLQLKLKIYSALIHGLGLSYSNEELYPLLLCIIDEYDKSNPNTPLYKIASREEFANTLRNLFSNYMADLIPINSRIGEGGDISFLQYYQAIHTKYVAIVASENGAKYIDAAKFTSLAND
jgi:hypothetical protein